MFITTLCNRDMDICSLSFNSCRGNNDVRYSNVILLYLYHSDKRYCYIFNTL